MFNFGQLDTYTFHITLADLFCLITTIAGLTFALLLAFVKSANRNANRFLALALLIMIVWMMRILAIRVGLDEYLPHWDRFPMQFLLALGPLFYFYVLKITRPQSRFNRKDILHFAPLMLEQVALIAAIRESRLTGAPVYLTQTFQQLYPLLELLIFISMMAYLYKCNRLIQDFYRGLHPILMDRPLVEFRWLRLLLAITALLWCLWIACAANGYFFYHDETGVQANYPFYLFFGVMIIWTAAAAFLNPQAGAVIQARAPLRPLVPDELRAKATRVKKSVEANRYYEDPDLSLPLLAEKLGISAHDLSRIINTVFKKSFNDFINEYRVRDVIAKMQNPAFDNITFLGIAFEAGFNSKSTFNRTFRQLTGKTPAEYKKELENKVSSYQLTPYPPTVAVISNHQSTHAWVDMKLNRRHMLKNYLKPAWRSLARNKVYSLFNVLGLSLGICACLVIYLITQYEFGFDKFHPDRDRIFCVDAGMNRGHMNCVPGPMPAAMRREMTGFETVAAYHTYTAGVTIPGGENEEPRRFDDDGSIVIAEPQYFDIFQYQWLSGNAATSLSMPNSVVLTAEKARRYFGNLQPESIIGRTIHYQDSLIVTVTGVVADWTGNSDFNFKQWISHATIPVSFLKNEINLDSWNRLELNSHVITKLAKDVRASQVDGQLIEFTKRHFDQDGRMKYSAHLRPMYGSHFQRDYGSESRKASRPVLYTLMAVAGFILILAIVNFVNLSTAQSMRRAREIGIRKVLGGSRSGIATQFFTETLLLTVAAGILAALMVTPVFALFEGLVPQGVRFRPGSSTLLFLLFIIALITFLAGFYPAKVLGKYDPSVTLKGIAALPGAGKGMLRRGLIVFQFTISLLFIIASLVIGSQLRYILKVDLGFSTDAIITLNEPHNNREKVAIRSDDEPLPANNEAGKTAALVNKIRHLNGVAGVMNVWMPPMGRMHMHFSGCKVKNSDEKPIEVSVHTANAAYVPFYGIKLLAGRNMLPGDSTRELLLSESAARDLGFANLNEAIGKDVEVGPREAYPVVGIVANFQESSIHRRTPPIVIRHVPSMELSVAVKITAKHLASGDLKTLINSIEKEWKTVYRGEPFGYTFLDESIANMYAEDLRTGRLTNLAMAVTVLISCLGLLGLAIFSTDRRTREIGIRKVFGATVQDIVVMLCKEIVVLILVALLIATPIAWYFMHGWLQGFAYRTAISVWMFVAAGLAAIGIALLTVSFQAIKAAIANPVRTLRTE